MPNATATAAEIIPSISQFLASTSSSGDETSFDSVFNTAASTRQPAAATTEPGNAISTRGLVLLIETAGNLPCAPYLLGLALLQLFEHTVEGKAPRFLSRRVLLERRQEIPNDHSRRYEDIVASN